MFDTHLPNGVDKPSMKKPIYPVSKGLRNYLQHYGREFKLPGLYEQLTRFTYTVPIKDKDGKATAWERTIYDTRDWNDLRENLVMNYAILKTKGDFTFVNQLDLAGIDFCYFGNSQPFRIRIINRFNDNYDHYYIKQADSSRIYGIELEHILSPSRITYFTCGQTLMEEHIPGIPGDIFVKQYLNSPDTNLVRLSKQFVKFNERCFTHLLGDMRSYNFVVNITPDIVGVQYKFMAIDFDQQSYEGRKNFYLPQFFKENKPFVDAVMKTLNKESVEQYRAEERTLMAFRLSSAKYRIKELLDNMHNARISTTEKIFQLKEELAEYFDEPSYFKAETMGQIVKKQLKQNLKKSLSLLPKRNGRLSI